MLKVGLTQRVEITETGERRDCLDQAWTELLATHDILPVPLPNESRNAKELFVALGLDGIILTGGNDLSILESARNVAPERDHFETEILKVCTEKKLPVLGVCRGMQMLLTASEIPLIELSEHAGTHHPLSVTEQVPGFLDLPTVNSFHHFGFMATAITPPWRILAKAFDGSVEAVRHSSLPFWGVMWHPERKPQNPGNSPLIETVFKRKRE